MGMVDLCLLKKQLFFSNCLLNVTEVKMRRDFDLRTPSRGVAGKRGYLILTASVLAFLLAALLSVRAYAGSADDVAGVINAWDHGGIVFDPLEAASDGKTVTVTGDIMGVDCGLSLDIDAGVTVDWRASLEGTSYTSDIASPLALVSVRGGGVFAVAGGGAISVGGDYSRAIDSAGVIVDVAGGEVWAEGDYCAAISARAGGEVNILDGDIYSIGRGCDSIAADSRGGVIRVRVHDGLISARGDDCSAIDVSFGTKLIVSGGEIDSIGTPCVAVKAAHRGTTVTVSGGKMSVSDALGSPGTSAIVAEEGAVCDITGGTIIGEVVELPAISPTDNAVGGDGGGCDAGLGAFLGMAIAAFSAFGNAENSEHSWK